MVALVASMCPIPDDLAITERSRKFYDRTFKWDSDGFTDEHGVYREYDCLDPLARAPTPLPPMFSDDDDEEDVDQIGPMPIEPAQLLNDGSTVASTDRGLEPDTPCPRLNGSTVTAAVPRTPGSIRRFAIDFLANPKLKKTTPEREVDMDPQDANGDTTTGDEEANTVDVLHRSYELCGGPTPAKKESSNLKMPDTPPDSPVKTRSIVQNTSPTSTISTLSPVPSNLSDQNRDEGIRIKGTSTITRSTPSLSSTPSKISPPPKKSGTTTRGVAQKVTKGSRRASASKSSPSKRKDNSVEDFTLLELHSGSFQRRGGLRKSARLAKSEGN